MSVRFKKYFSVVGILFLIVLSVVTYTYWVKVSDANAIPEHLRGIGGDFVLQSADGPVSVKDYHGKVVMLFFGYTNCPDVCPLTMSNWSAAFDKLSTMEVDNVRGLFVSVDPDRDTPALLKDYTGYFHSNITGVTGSHEELKKIAALYRSEYHLENEGRGDDYPVDHMSFVYVIDRKGRVHDLLSHDSSPDDITKSLRKLL